MLTSSRFVTSALTARATPPSFSMLAFSSCSRSRRLAAMATLHPALAKCCAMAAPLPLDAPVTMATLSSNARSTGRGQSTHMIWRHEMETFSALLALCAGNSPVTGEFPSQRPLKQNFDVFVDLRLNKQLSKPSRRRWFETPLHSLWRLCNVRNTLRRDFAHPDYLFLEVLIRSGVGVFYLSNGVKGTFVFCKYFSYCQAITEANIISAYLPLQFPI